MVKEIILTPEELYYLGRFMQAKYIDYAYIAAMDDIKQNYALFEKEAQDSLVAAGVLNEDFGGNIEIDAEALELLKPIFFGEVESSLDICTLGEINTVSVNKFHFNDGAITSVAGDNGKLIIKAVDQIAIRELISGVVAENYAGISEFVEEIDKEKITRFIVAKNIAVGNTAVVKTFIESDGIIYRENQEKIESVTRDMFVSDAYDVVKGV